jgi:trans-aconitate methyltransferase
MALFTVDSEKYSHVKDNAVAKYSDKPTLLAVIGDLSKCKHVLDAGCGVGTNTILLCTHCGAKDVTAIDCDQSMVETTQRAICAAVLVCIIWINWIRFVLQPENVTIQVEQIDINAMTYINVFDVVLCNYVLQFSVNEQQLQLSCIRLYESLTVGGRLVAFIPNCQRDAVITEEMGKIYGNRKDFIVYISQLCRQSLCVTRWQKYDTRRWQDCDRVL